MVRKTVKMDEPANSSHTSNASPPNRAVLNRSAIDDLTSPIRHAGKPKTPWLTYLLGRPLASDEQEGRKIGVFAGVPALGLDGLSSAAYGPEAALTILLPLGAAGLGYIGPIRWRSWCCWASLHLLPADDRRVSGEWRLVYRCQGKPGPERQPAGGRRAMLDYVLNVAVGISAGVGALVSAVPALQSIPCRFASSCCWPSRWSNLRGTSKKPAGHSPCRHMCSSLR